MLHLDISADVKEAERLCKELEQRAVAIAAYRGINDTLTTLRKEGAQEIKKQHPALRSGHIKQNIRLQKAHPNRLSGAIETSGKPLSLKLFGLSVQAKRGLVTARIGTGKRGAVSYHGRKAFIVQRYDGEVFVRKHATGRQIRRYRGPSLPGVFRAQGKKFTAIANQRWPRAFENRLKYQIALAERRAAAK